MIKPEVAADDRDLVAAAIAGDEAAFASLTRRHRRELHVHCYRMVASFENAEDLVQETLLRAWQKRSTFEGRATFRSWLYRIATNACLDFIEKNKRQVSESDLERNAAGLLLPAHVAWLQPYPDRLLDQTAPQEREPDAQVVAKENIELAFLVALQFLPAKQRAVLILSDVLDWSASEMASLLDETVPAVNGALRRARETLRKHQPPRARVASPAHGTQEHELLERFVSATERCDHDALAQMLRDDVRCSMPPQPESWSGRDSVRQSWVESGFGEPPFNDFKCIVTHANRMPCIAAYVRQQGDAVYRPLAMDVLRIEDGAVAEVTTFELAPWLEAFGLPATIQ